METKTERVGLSGRELIAYIEQFKGAKECAAQLNEDTKEFVRDVETLADSISNLYEASKIALALGGVAVTVKVVARDHPLFEAKIGDPDSADKLMKSIIGVDINGSTEGVEE